MFNSGEDAVPTNSQQEQEGEYCQTLSVEQQEAILDLISVFEYPKGTIMLSEGEINASCYSVLKGLVRQYYLVDGEEKTTFFYAEGQSIFRPKGSKDRLPVSHYLSCEEDTILTATSIENENELFRRFPEMMSLSRGAIEEELGNYQEMMALFMSSTPEQRYTRLLKTRPGLINRVPQYHLASYLGVRPESLSRIRKRIVSR